MGHGESFVVCIRLDNVDPIAGSKLTDCPQGVLDCGIRVLVQQLARNITQ